MSQNLQPFAGNINFNAHHSPMGVFMSFTYGNFGTRGGVGLQIGQLGGVHNNFSVHGASSYDLKNLTGCFSFRTRSRREGEENSQRRRCCPCEMAD